MPTCNPLRLKILATQFALAILFTVCFNQMTTAAPAPNQKQAIRNVVLQMNQAITSRETDKLLATFAEGAVKIDLFPAHIKPGPKIAHQIVTADLKKRWQAVTEILFSSTQFYKRAAKNMTIHSDGRFATVWATIDTSSQPLHKNAAIQNNQYSELYLLRLIGNDWKIAAISNNRQPKQIKPSAAKNNH
jgi:ketosteroid isomerase-like protein